ncbi:discoidin domain-containing protein [Nonomuraea sp. NPDC050328]|uniref:discoidin domain-containing protein n=1 Tax=Nonomuraea sp. NPDC050328 TaxID=3364361 RepID=UPI0037A58F79
MRTRFGWAGLALLAMMASFATPAHARAAGTTFYVDAESGDDTAAGTSRTTAWKSLAKAGTLRLGPGDRLLFRAGQRWQGRLLLQGAGAPGAPALVGSYGEGPKPVIDGQGLVESAVRISDVHDFTVDGLEVTNYSADTSAYRSGVNLYAKDSGRLENVTLRNLTIHGVNGQGGHSVAAAGLLISIRGNTTPTYFHNLVVEKNEISRIGSYGIIMWSTWSRRSGMTSLYPVETGIPDSEVVTWTPSTGVRISDNYVHDVTGGGITPMHTAGAVIERNRVERAVRGRTKTTGGNVGIWWQGNDDIVVQHNEVSHTGFNGPGSDGHGFDADADNNRSLVQYNYSHHNDGGFFLAVSFAAAPTRDTVVRYNVSRDDGFEGLAASTSTTGTHFLNNTLYITDRVVEVKPPFSGAGKYPFEQVVRLYNNAADVTVRNNVFVNLAGAGFDNKNGIVYDHNLYWGKAGGNGRPPTGQDHAPVVADPKLAEPGSADPAGYRPLPGSPALDAGVTVDSGLFAQGTLDAGRDYAGTPIPDGAPDLGAFQREIAPARVAATLVPQGHLERLADRDQATAWRSVPKPRLPGTVELTYPVARTFRTVTVSAAHAASRAVTEAEVQTHDGRDWVSRGSAKLVWKTDDDTVERQPITLPETVTASRVRLIVKAAAGGPLQINEIALGVPAAGEPYRPGPSTVASTTFQTSPTHTVDALVDGDPGSPWASVSEGVSFPGEFVVDYGSDRPIAAVTLHTAWAKGQGVTDVSLDTWDGTRWVSQAAHHRPAWQELSAKVETSTITLPSPVSTRKIRLTVHDANLQWGNIALYEITTS